MTLSDLCAEIMKQNYISVLGKNYFKLAILIFIKNHKFQFSKISLFRFSQFIYRFYRDNNNYADASNYIMLKNISKYTPEDIIPIVKTELYDWIKNGQNVLMINNDIVFINPDLELAHSEINMVNNLIDAIMIQNYGEKLNYKEDFVLDNKSICFSDYDKYIEDIRHTPLFNRAFESLNYCCCCDKIGSDLVCVHINLENELENPNNTLIFCYEHGKQFFNKQFYFNKNGKIKIIKESEDLDNRMHLSRKILNMKKDFLIEDEN